MPSVVCTVGDCSAESVPSCVEETGCIDSIPRFWVPSHGEHWLSVKNGTDDQVTVEIHVERKARGETVVDESLTIDADSSERTEAFDRKFGQYRATLETDQFDATFEWEEREYQFPMRWIVIDTDGITHEPRPVED